MSLELTPILRPDRPTSRVAVGRSTLDAPTEVVKIRHRGVHAFFRVDPVDDGAADSIGNKVYLNENVADLFGGIDRAASFTVETDPELRSVQTCERATLHARGVSESSLASALADREYLLHPGIVEVAGVDGDAVAFAVADADPSAYATLRVTDETEFAFTDETDFAFPDHTEFTFTDDPPSDSSPVATPSVEADVDRDPAVGAVSPADELVEQSDEEFLEEIMNATDIETVTESIERVDEHPEADAASDEEGDRR